MQIYVRVKAIGKRKDMLQLSPYRIPDSVRSLRDLLAAIAASEAERYNQKQTDAQLIPYLTAEDVDAGAAAGKVSFGRIFSEKKADKEKAVNNVIQCWKDGLVRVFMNDDEVTELDAELSIRENTVFTFIRLTFLAGRMW